MWWTTEQVAEHADMTVEEVWTSRRRKEWPGVLGIRQGRRLRFDSERVKEGPREAEHTDDVAVATLWMMEDIRNLLGQIHTAIADIRRWQAEDRPRWLTVDFDGNDTDVTGNMWVNDEERADDGTD